MTSLVRPHGGLAEPVCRTVAAESVDDFLARAKTLPQVPVSDADLSDGLSPGRRRSESADRPDGLGHLRPRARRIGHRARRQAVCLDHPVGAAGFAGPGRAAKAGPAGRFGFDLGRHRRRAGRQRRISVGQGKISAFGLSDRKNGSSRRRHGAQGGRRKDASSRRRNRDASAGEGFPVRQIRAFASRGSPAVGRQGMAARRGVSDPQSFASRPRIRPCVRAGNAAAGRSQRRRVPESVDRRDQEGTTCTPTFACTRTRP